MSVRGILRGFGLKVGPRTPPRTVAGRVRELVAGWWPAGGRLVAGWWPAGGQLVASWWPAGGELVAGHPTLTAVAEALLAAREALRRAFRPVERRLLAPARTDARVRTLMSPPGVGALVALRGADARRGDR